MIPVRLLKILFFIIAIIYIISPVDFICDFIPIIGYIDDLFVGLIALIVFLKTGL